MSKKNQAAVAVNNGAAAGAADGGAADRDRLFDLYLARVAKAETVMTVRRDAKAIFRDALAEAKCALDVYLETENGGK